MKRKEQKGEIRTCTFFSDIFSYIFMHQTTWIISTVLTQKTRNQNKSIQTLAKFFFLKKD